MEVKNGISDLTFFLVHLIMHFIWLILHFVILRWLNLLNLDVIKAKNKPKAPPKKPKAAPFFLPTIPGLEQQ